MPNEKNKKITKIQNETENGEYFPPENGFDLRSAACFVCATVP
jgi:hypothetical protein